MQLTEMKLTKKGIEILKEMGRRGPLTYYDLCKEKGGIVSRSTAHILLKDLKKKGLIAVTKKEGYDVRGRKRNFWNITFEALKLPIWEDRKQLEKMGYEIELGPKKAGVVRDKHGRVKGPVTLIEGATWKMSKK